MKNPSVALLITVIAMVGGSAALLLWLKTHQQIGLPGVRTEAIPGSPRLRILLPEKVLDYESQTIEQDAVIANTLPKDTSFAERLYRARDGFVALVGVVLMGTDRTSIHKPQFCLVGSGWRIDKTDVATVPVPRPHPYELPVVKLTTTKEGTRNDQLATVRGVYVYWFVADNAISGEPSGFQRMWWMAKKLLTTGILQRWAYITYFSECPPGQEEATFGRLKQFIAASVPEFQLAAGQARVSVAAPQSARQ
jgi:hypothetical protein